MSKPANTSSQEFLAKRRKAIAERAAKRAQSEARPPHDGKAHDAAAKTAAASGGAAATTR